MITDNLAYRFSARNRRRKLQLFMTTMRPMPSDTIVDVGVNATEYSASDNYLEKHYPYPQKITAVALENAAGFSSRYPKIPFIRANGCNLPFKTNQFAIGYSNAVLEHVGSPDDQCAFIKELYRVSRRGYLAIPNKYFPVEVHTRIPLLHLFLPKQWFDRVAILIKKKWATGDYMHFLDVKEFTSLLARAGIGHLTIHRQRLFGFTITLVATWGKTPRIY